MNSIAHGFGFIAVTALVVIAGDYLLKLAADRGLPVISALLWFGAMRHLTLGMAGVAYSMLTLVALALIGAVMFGERLGLRECAGIGCALTAMLLMVRVE